MIISLFSLKQFAWNINKNEKCVESVKFYSKRRHKNFIILKTNECVML